MLNSKLLNIKSHLKRISVLFFVCLSVVIYVSTPFNVAAQGADVIRDVNDAAAFCRTLPSGTANITPHGYCAFTMAGKSPACFVASNQGYPDFSESCATLLLRDMVGESKAALSDEVAQGGGTSTEPVPAGDLYKMLQLVINLLSAIAGLAFVVSFIFAGFQYMTARDNSGQVAAAKERIFTIVITFVLFVFGYGLLQWLVPGGVF